MGAHSVTLVGMPGSGKSTIGVQLAKRLLLGFVDTDLLLQTSLGCSLQTFIAQEGYLALRAREQQVICGMAPERVVIATGGSAVYGELAVEHLRRHSLIVYLEIDLPTMLARIGDYSERGITLAPGMSLADMFAERRALYEKFASHTVDARLPVEAVLDQVEATLARRLLK